MAQRPADANILNTLGVCQYRAAEYYEAVKTLTRADELHLASREGPQIADVAFLAMSLYRVGRVDEARGQLERLQTITMPQDPEAAGEAMEFQCEAEMLILGSEPAGAASAPVGDAKD